MSLLKVNEIENLAGGDPGIQGAAKAFVNFDGTTTPPTIRHAFNVSGVVRNATGDFTITFGAALEDSSFCAAEMINWSSDARTGFCKFNSATPDSLNVKTGIHSSSSNNGNALNFTDVSVTVHR